MRTWWLLALVHMAVIFVFSAQSGEGVGIPAPWDKLAHALEYALLGFLLARATGSWRAAWVIAALYGASDEIHQAFVPMRSAGLDDWLADLSGAFVGACLGAGRWPKRAHRHHNSARS
ncbi:VanZ family protein [Deinococcus peraridilitoris]|uniref:Putative integral membrane protein n=1 Tax=Deinococcus peraridilitoris (strain DSM 19664 / LMG 22246 / CIP 109416 / KR-200) TaxID=937777 RepID=K9ZXU0_DEIPD|nr:VanZ family protein [Deinococcus peraridilitoris]AFZ66416.1 putative integral membrane protein [Deinococcus peraridilitoris DSM 19664]